MKHMFARSPVGMRTVLAFFHDVVAVALAWLLAFWFRFNLDFPTAYVQAMLVSLPAIIGVQSLIFLAFGLYKGIWRYASLPDLKRIVAAVAVAALASPTLLWLLRMNTGVPRSVLLMDPILLLLIMGGSRLAYRAWKEHRVHGLLASQGEPVLVLGAGDAAVSLLKELARSQEWRPVGLLDDSEAKHGRLLHGVKVLGGFDALPHWAGQLGVKHAIIAMPSASHQVRRRAVEICTAAGMVVLTVPAFEDLMSGRVTVSQIRKVEVEDLLGREPVVLDSAGLHELINGRTVMVTGAGGSIGSELCRQIARFGPARLVLFELSEFALYRIEQALRETFREVPLVCVIGDVKDECRVGQVLATYRPNAVFHAAAYKHVPLMENENAWEAMRNNVLGTYVLGKMAIRHGVKKFVFISTDKAVNPTNVMGASKRCAEMVCQALEKVDGTRFVMVRFGNVLGSTGSVIPKFQEQIAKGGPVTVTHPDIIRYFMSIPEAAQLVLQAGVMGRGGELFVLDMGEPVKIVDLARDMIRLSGFGEDEIKIIFTGLRPGEKLFEELLTDDERTLSTPHPKLRIARARPAEPAWLEELNKWLTQEGARSEAEVKQTLRHWLPEYAPSGG
ncbi:MAG: polysaccharide biosynthesis protein [Burkholderiales bacterium]